MAVTTGAFRASPPMKGYDEVGFPQRATQDRVPQWTAGQVAGELGISQSTLRSWHRRYGLEPVASRPGTHRRYSTDDIVLLSRLCELVNDGVRPSVAAGLLNGTMALREVRKAVMAAVKRLDTSACTDLVTWTIHRWGVVRTWDSVCRPLLTSIEQAQVNFPDCAEDEHALSWSVTAALRRVRQPRGAASTLLACAPGEQHSLPIDALAAALAECGVATRVLGAAVPEAALIRAITSTRPHTVLLWSHSDDPAHRCAAEAAAELVPRFVVAGPGWRSSDDLGARPTSLSEAVAVVRGSS